MPTSSCIAARVEYTQEHILPLYIRCQPFTEYIYCEVGMGKAILAMWQWYPIYGSGHNLAGICVGRYWTPAN